MLSALLLALPCPGRAQSLHGTAVERANGAPVPGVVLLLLDTAGLVRARALTNELGEYRLAATTAGTYRVRTLRVGYRPLVTAPFDLAVDSDVEHVLELLSVPFSLDTVRVIARGRCGALSDSAGTVAAVWEQARTALTATQITAAARTMRAITARFYRATDASARRVLSETITTDTNYVSKPWRSRSADSLRRFGYTHLDPDGMRTYHAPDIDVLLSSEFLQDHCFRLAPGPISQSIGIAFEPTRDRSENAEIAGMLLLDRATSELRSLEFNYVNTGTRGIEEAGASIAFARMSNGGWVITHWGIRMPLLEERRVGTAAIPGAMPRTELRVREWRIAGGDLSLVTRAGDTLWSKPAVTVAVQLPRPSAATDSVARPRASARDTAVLAQVDVRASRPMLTEFEERRAGRTGHYLTRAELAKQEGRALPDILVQLPGVRIVRSDGKAILTSGRGIVTGLNERRQITGRFDRDPQRACYADVYLDGALMYGGKKDESFFDVGGLPPSLIEGIEYYASPAQTPVRYSRPGATCGTMLIWTRKP